MIVVAPVKLFVIVGFCTELHRKLWCMGKCTALQSSTYESRPHHTIRCIVAVINERNAVMSSRSAVSALSKVICAKATLDAYTARACLYICIAYDTRAQQLL
jgi:hypothetical protein